MESSMMSQVLEVCNSGGRVLGIGNVCKGYMLVSFRVKVLFSLQTEVEKLKTLCPYVFSHAVLFEGRTLENTAHTYGEEGEYSVSGGGSGGC